MLSNDREKHQTSFLVDDDSMRDEIISRIAREELERAFYANIVARIAVREIESFTHRLGRTMRKVVSRLR